MASTVKRNDTAPWEITLGGKGLKQSQLTSAQSIHLFAVPMITGLGEAFDGPCELNPTSDLTVTYAPQPGDVAECGFFNAEIEVVYADGTRETFPNGEYVELEIVADLG